MGVALEPERHVLIIPPSGLLEVIHTDKSIDISATLLNRGNEGEFVALDLSVANKPLTRVYWYASQIGPINPRAQQAMLMLTGTHMIFTGHVLFYGMAPENVYEIVARLSRKE